MAEKSMTGKVRFNSGSLGALSVLAAMKPGVKAKFDSSSMVERSVVNWLVRFSAALTRRLRYMPVFLGFGEDSRFSEAGEIFCDSFRKSKLASFLGLCLAFQ